MRVQWQAFVAPHLIADFPYLIFWLPTRGIERRRIRHPIFCFAGHFAAQLQSVFHAHLNSGKFFDLQAPTQGQVLHPGGWAIVLYFNHQIQS